MATKKEEMIHTILVGIVIGGICVGVWNVIGDTVHEVIDYLFNKGGLLVR